MSFLLKLRDWGRDNLEKKGLAPILQHLHVTKKMSCVVIGVQFQTESRTVRFWIDAFQIETTEFTPRIVAEARKRKYATLADYFRDHWKSGFQKMSDELKVSRTTVESYYRVFTEELEKEEEANVQGPH